MTPPINSVSDEEIARLVKKMRTKTERVHDLSGVGYNDDLDCHRAADLLEAFVACRNTPVDGVTIKPLEWGDHDSLSIIAHTVLGPYLVEVINSPRVALWLPNMTGQARKMIEGFDSVEDAKAAAQADFNARIQSCLTSPAAEPVAWSGDHQVAGEYTRRFTAMKRVAEIWAEQGINVTPLYPAPSASREVTGADIERARDICADYANFIRMSVKGEDIQCHPYLPAIDDVVAALSLPHRGMTGAACDVLSERRRQIEAEGWTPEHDDQLEPAWPTLRGPLALAAAAYAIGSGDLHPSEAVYSIWPWAPEEFKPTEPRRDLVKAGALILAELERLDRAALLAALPEREG